MVGRAAQLTVRNQPKRRGFTLTQVNHVLGNPCERAVRTVNPLAASTGASNHIPDQTARGSRDASSTAGSSRAYGNARLSCTRRESGPSASASSIPAPAVSILAYHRVRFPEILPPSPRYKARRGRGEGEAQPGSRTAQLHRTLPSASSVRPPPCPSPILGTAAFCSLPKHAHQPLASRLHRRRRTAGEGDAAGKRRRLWLWLAGARWEWDTPVVQSHGAELLRRGRVHAPLRRGAQQHPVL